MSMIASVKDTEFTNVCKLTANLRGLLQTFDAPKVSIDLLAIESDSALQSYVGQNKHLEEIYVSLVNLHQALQTIRRAKITLGYRVPAWIKQLDDYKSSLLKEDSVK